jgi:hypothetical protein
MHLWDKLLEQAVLTLNLLRGSRINPKLSAYAQVFGHFDFDKTPIAPPGTRIMVHEKPKDRSTWAPHAVDGWYLGPALKHYRCFRAHIWATGKERISDTVTWYPQHVKMPLASSVDIIHAATSEIVKALQQPVPNAVFEPLHASQLEALTKISEILLNLQQKSILSTLHHF